MSSSLNEAGDEVIDDAKPAFTSREVRDMVSPANPIGGPAYG
jgi:hypothetical protein